MTLDDSYNRCPHCNTILDNCFGDYKEHNCFMQHLHERLAAKRKKHKKRNKK